MTNTRQRVGFAVVAEPGEREQRHVSDRVLVAGRDKCQQTPPDSDKFRRPFSAQRHPDCQANQPVTQCTFEEEYHCRCSGFSQRDGVNDAGIYRQQATAAPAIKHGNEDGTDQVTQPGLRQDCPHLPVADAARFYPKGEEHGVSGEQFRTGDNHQR